MPSMHPPRPPIPVFPSVRRRLREFMRQAREEALALGHGYIGPEHMLLALTVVDAGVFARAGVEPGAIRQRLHAVLTPGTLPELEGEMPITSRSRKVIELVTREAQAARRNVRPIDVLVGIAAEKENPGAVVLRELGVTAESLRSTAAQAEVADGAFHLKIDESSERSIFEQIVDGIQEGIATGRLKPGKRLPSVRRLADRLDVAPGTVARAYAELERRAVVVTDGARGTRVAERTPGPGPAEALDRLLKPVVVAAFHMGATLHDLRAALDRVSRGILDEPAS